jgi:hypothetical protein
MAGDMATLNPEVSLIERFENGFADHNGVTSTMMPPFGYRSITYFLPAQ